MKKCFLLLILICSLKQISKAQYVTIPDANFRNFLKSLYPTCFNSNSQMDTTCSEILNESYLSVNNKNISSLQGIQFFKNLRELYCSKNRLTILPDLPKLLIALRCDSNLLVSLPSLPTSLYFELVCNNNNLASLPRLPDTLGFLNCDYNQLVSLPSLPRSLRHLQCVGNQLVSFPSLPGLLTTFYCGRNKLTALPPLPNSLLVVSCSSNNLTSLPALPGSLVDLYCEHNDLYCLPIIPFAIQSLYIGNNHITCLPNAVNSHVYTDSVLPICTTLSDACNLHPLVQGKIYIDADNNNSYNWGEILLSQQIVKVSPGNWIGGSDINGSYFISVDTVINNTWSVVNHYLYATVFPPSYSLSNLQSVGLLNGSYDFGIHFIANVKDLYAQLESAPARPGFPTNITLTANNVGTVNQSNITVKLKKPNGFNVVSTSIAPNATINDTLIWTNISISYLNSKSFNVQLQVPSSATIGSNVNYEAWVNCIQGDSTPADNYAKWIEIVRGSFDPNEKLVNKENLMPTYNANTDRLTYTIRFQNTGTDTAFTVIVRDVIPSNLDVTSLRVVNASHPYQLIVREKNIIEVAFPNIQLPDSNINEPKSHGFVQLEFKPKAGLPVNSEINNDASILFDYNAAVVTNTATTKVQIVTGIASNKNLSFKLFPNPTSENITVALPYSGSGKWYLSDISGKPIKQNQIENGIISFAISVNDLSNGTYFLSMEINGIVSTSKVVITR